MLDQLSVWLPNVPGMLSKFLQLLIENEIEVKAITVAENEDYGLLLLLVDKPDKCVELLEEEDYPVSRTNVVGVKLQSKNHTKGLQGLSKVLGENSVNIDYLYSAVIKDEVLIILKVDDDNKAREVLKKEGFSLEDGTTF
jgi:hypothetical protein